MNKTNINSTKPSLRLTENMIPRHVKVKLAGCLILLGIMQNVFYSLINISLNDLYLIFDSKIKVTIAIGYVCVLFVGLNIFTSSLVTTSKDF